MATVWQVTKRMAFICCWNDVNSNMFRTLDDEVNTAAWARIISFAVNFTLIGHQKVFQTQRRDLRVFLLHPNRYQWISLGTSWKLQQTEPLYNRLVVNRESDLWFNYTSLAVVRSICTWPLEFIFSTLCSLWLMGKKKKFLVSFSMNYSKKKKKYIYIYIVITV